MPKVSRPIVYTALAAVAAYALFLNTQPDKPTTRRVSHTLLSARASDPNGILPADLNTHFTHYTGGKRDPFVPGVTVARLRVQKAAEPPTLSGSRTGWALTGINSVNGVRSALIENSATGDSVFLQPGDRWNGLRVAAIQSSSVLLKDGQGHGDTLTFAAPPDDGSGSTDTGTGSKTGKSGGPPSLPPYPVAPLPIRPLPGTTAQRPLPPLGVAPKTATNTAPPGNAPPSGPQGGQ